MRICYYSSRCCAQHSLHQVLTLKRFWFWLLNSCLVAHIIGKIETYLSLKKYDSNWKCPVKGIVSIEEKTDPQVQWKLFIKSHTKRARMSYSHVCSLLSLSYCKSSRTKCHEIFWGKESVDGNMVRLWAGERACVLSVLALGANQWPDDH